MDIPITVADIAGFFVESVAFGIYLVSLGYCSASLFHSGARFKRAAELNWPMVIASLAMFVVSTLDLAMGLYRILLAFVQYTGPGGAEQILTDISKWFNVGKTACVLLQSTIGDTMLIYRCWVVYNRSYKAIAFPALVWLGGTASYIYAMHIMGNLHEVHSSVSESHIEPYITAFFGLTIGFIYSASTNHNNNALFPLISPGLLVWRIWRVDRQRDLLATYSSHRPPSSLRRVMRSIIESGVLYTVFTLITFITYTARSNSSYIASAAELQVVGIAFNLIIIRAARHKDEEDAIGSTTRVQSCPLRFISPSQTQFTVPPRPSVQESTSHEVDIEINGGCVQLDKGPT
ncbi:hypothetical protein BV22DRAFT_1141549 [Leucogyrophana mollusca]|uniref:Uncharacterized protein n=1 Tax=Leucogyrophana mollusca TaxID=85980 RepID=A0ACB8BX06_9AGAM|nr:hypothetical protein BV22DRAFT_1141549 [Leucogyrophana mollusca]